MSKLLVSLITSPDPAVRNQSLEVVAGKLSLRELLEECAALEAFRQTCENLYQRVRALLFLHAIYRYALPTQAGLPRDGRIPREGFARLLVRRFEEAIRLFLEEQQQQGPSDPLCSALANAYRQLAFQTLASQVRRSVRAVRGNQWMFRVGHPADHPLRIRPELLQPDPATGMFPVLRERTPVRMDLCHSGWSDIFFLAMDYPEGARVLNVSVDLGVRGRDAETRPPIEVVLRVLNEPVLRLVSVDLEASADITELREVFDFARDHLGLLKAGVIASGLVPPGLEGSEQQLTDLLAVLAGPGRGLELVSHVNGIPKGSRLAVSTNLLAALIAACMRATRQARSLEGPLHEEERQLVAARAILGEWLGGSGGGWQDSGGLWPSVKLIEGAPAGPRDPEHGISRGRLLPRHTVLGPERLSPTTLRGLEECLVLVHGGLAQNVGPILEMVTEKYLLRGAAEWQARGEAGQLLASILTALERGDLRGVGGATTRNFEGPVQTIIPAASNDYTEALIATMRQHFGNDFWGFCMLGGMSGGGMAFLVAPQRKAEAQQVVLAAMQDLSRRLAHSLPFGMEPVVYNFAVNTQGTVGKLLTGAEALLPAGYYLMQAPEWLRQDPRRPQTRHLEELRRFTDSQRQAATGAQGEFLDKVFKRLVPATASLQQRGEELHGLLRDNGFDVEEHERIRAGLLRGVLGLAHNRLPPSTQIEDVQPGDIVDARSGLTAEHRALGKSALASGQVAVVTLAAGAGTRWTGGAGVVKGLVPFVKLAGRHRTFLEIHLAKSLRSGRQQGTPVPHLITTSYLTHEAIRAHLSDTASYGYGPWVRLSPGRAIGLRLVPMVRDLRFAWEEVARQQLDEQAQKVRNSLQAAYIDWAQRAGEGSDYTDNLPQQCLHPIGHWYEVPNLLRNGTLAALLGERPQLRYLMVHNVDTVGANVDPGLLGLHIASEHGLTFEVIGRRVDDHGGGLARVNGVVRLVEGLALPRAEDELGLSYYNTLTTWVDIDRLLGVFGLARADLADPVRVAAAVRRLSGRMPSYITLKDVKKRWGHGQEDVLPVCQFEKLWGDMSALTETSSGFVVVERCRGQQLKEPAQLDGWLRDGSAAYVDSLCAWQ